MLDREDPTLEAGLDRGPLSGVTFIFDPSLTVAECNSVVAECMDLCELSLLPDEKPLEIDKVSEGKARFSGRIVKIRETKFSDQIEDLVAVLKQNPEIELVDTDGESAIVAIGKKVDSSGVRAMQGATNLLQSVAVGISVFIPLRYIELNQPFFAVSTFVLSVAVIYALQKFKGLLNNFGRRRFFQF